jgi:phenylalanyl-tRNA synthetase beta chain
MRISYNWLSEYVDHRWSPERVADALTMAGLEVEDIEHHGAKLDGIVVGAVLETRRHPDADRLTLCRVDIGSESPLSIVCGASNVAAGQKVPVALIGTTLMLPSRKQPGEREPVTLQRTKIRGEVSEGMICAEDELGFSNDHSGIMVLGEDAVPGTPLSSYMTSSGREVDDRVLDVNITPNRPDATSHLGVARDIAALCNQLLALPEVSLPMPGGAAAECVNVDIEAPDDCPRYVAMVIRGVRVGPSPDWLRHRLEAVGLRPRNNVVDITNYVMFEFGQPLHAFDLNQLAGPRIIVRNARPGETITTLDSRERALPEGALLICDAQRPVAVAGVMGGENSEVTESTTDLLIESAYFRPASVRRTAKALGLQTDSSYRFERGVDAEGQLWAAARAAQLICELAGGEILDGCVDNVPRPHRRPVVELRPGRVRQILGTVIPTEEIHRLLLSIGFEIDTEDPLDTLAEQALEGRGLDLDNEETVLKCTVPPFRPDIEREIDVIEEVIRLWGYDRIPEPAHERTPAQPWSQPAAATLRRRAAEVLSGLGFREIYTNSMLRREVAERFNRVPGTNSTDTVVETLNPISLEMAALRPSLLPGMLQVMSFNRNHGQAALRFFEFGHIFNKTAREGTIIPGYGEREALIIASSGPAESLRWDAPIRKTDFFDLKGIVEEILDRLHLPNVRMEPVHQAGPISGYHVDILADNVQVGVIARLSDELAGDYDLRNDVFFAEINWKVLSDLSSARSGPGYHPVSRYPVVDRDLALVVKESVPAGSILDTIREAAGELLQETGVFDIFRGGNLSPDEKSVAVTLRFGANRTLQDRDVDSRIQAILKALSERFEAHLR